MRRLSLWALATSVFLLGSAPSARAQGNDLTGQRAPEIYVQEGIQGIPTGSSLSAYRGQVVVLKFWFTRCPSCRRSLPEFQALYQRYAPRGVRFVAIAYDEARNVQSYLRSTGFTFPVAIDSGGVTATRYGVFTYPTTYLIGADGIVKAYDQLSAPLIDRELEAARTAPGPSAGRRPLASFPRSAPTPPLAGTSPDDALTSTAPPAAPPVAPPLPVPPPVAAARPEPQPGLPAAPPVTVAPPAVPETPVAPDPLAGAPGTSAGLAALPADPTRSVPVAEAPGFSPVAQPEPSSAAGAAPSISGPTDRAPSDPSGTPAGPAAGATPPVPVDPALPAGSPEGTSARLPPQDRVVGGSVAPSEPVSGSQPASPDALAIPVDPASTAVPMPARADAAAPGTSAAPVPPRIPIQAEAPTAAPAPLTAPAAASLSGAADLVAAGDYPGVMRLVQAYSSARRDASAWLPADLVEARRLEDLVKEKYLDRHAVVREQWTRGEIEVAIEAARALSFDYRGTSLERSATALLRWFEANRPAASVSR